MEMRVEKKFIPMEHLIRARYTIYLHTVHTLHTIFSHGCVSCTSLHFFIHSGNCEVSVRTQFIFFERKHNIFGKENELDLVYVYHSTLLIVGDAKMK